MNPQSSMAFHETIEYMCYWTLGMQLVFNYHKMKEVEVWICHGVAHVWSYSCGK